MPIDTVGYIPNLACPFIVGPLRGFFDEADYLALLGPLAAPLWLYNRYCQCHHAYELGCAAKIAYPEFYGYVHPGESPKKWQEYCKFALVWNGDIAFEEVNSIGLSSEVQSPGMWVFLCRYSKGNGGRMSRLGII